MRGANVDLPWLQSEDASFTSTDSTPMSSYSAQHLAETTEIIQKLDPETLEKMVDLLVNVRARGGRIFFLGVGGSAANAQSTRPLRTCSISCRDVAVDILS